MLKNFLMVALRNFRKNKSFALINLAGLAVGMACFIVIMLYVQNELSFDRYHKKADRIYRVVAHQPGNVFLGTDHFAVTQAPLAPTLKESYPEVEEAVTIDHSSNVLISIGDQNFYENGLLWADSQIFDIFDFPLLQGNPETVLQEPYTILLSETYAQKYFGDEDPIGKVVRYQDSYDFKVTGVFRDIPQNSHFRFNMLTSFQTSIATSQYKEQFTEWGNSSWYTYILVQENFDPVAFESKLKDIVKKYHTEDWRDEDNPSRYYLQPLTRIHLHSHINFDIAQNIDLRYIYLLAVLAIVILAIACINYMNLTTARSSQRAREVGMRKVVGANRLSLVKQFVGESLFLTAVAGLAAIGLVDLLLPLFSNLVETELEFGMFLQPEFLISFFGVVILVGILSGIYPAFYLASFRPVRILKGEIQEGRTKKMGLRSALVVLQFAASIALIVCTMEVIHQLSYIKNKNLGYNREHVLVMRMRDRDAREHSELIKRELLENPNFILTTASNHLPTNVSSSTSLNWTKQDGQEVVRSYQMSSDPDFLDVFDIELVEGRNFSNEFATDSSDAYLINETLRDRLGWDFAADRPFGRNHINGRVIGVIKDFHMHSLRQEIKPLFIRMGLATDFYRPGYISARIRSENIPESVDHMRSVWEKYSAKYPFEYFFLDDRFNTMYKADEKLGRIFGYSTFLAIFIACLGLFGLASFLAESKTKEIGIRKVLGATIGSILTLLSKDFAKLVIFANLIAWPIAWLAINRWLQEFAYHIQIDWRLFLVAGVLALVITLLTVATQAIGAALANPVNSLRYE